MKRDMNAFDWRNKKVNFAEKDDNGNFIIRFEDGCIAKVKSEDAEFQQDDKLCNLCGLSCMIEEDPHGLIDKTITGGYHSTAGNGYGALDDCTKYKFSLCEFCLDWLFGKFQIPVDSVSYIDGELVHWRPAEQRVKEDDWRSFKEEWFKEFNFRNAARARDKK